MGDAPWCIVYGVRSFSDRVITVEVRAVCQPCGSIINRTNEVMFQAI